MGGRARWKSWASEAERGYAGPNNAALFHRRQTEAAVLIETQERERKRASGVTGLKVGLHEVKNIG